MSPAVENVQKNKVKLAYYTPKRVYDIHQIEFFIIQHKFNIQHFGLIES